MKRVPFPAVAAMALAWALSGCVAGSENAGAAALRGAPEGQLVRNGGFEDGGSPLAKGWIRDAVYTGHKGLASSDGARVHSGARALKLEPNAQNGGEFPLAVAQVISAGAYRGKRVRFSAFITTTGDAQPAVGMLSFVGGRGGNLVTVEATPQATEGWVVSSGLYDVPDDASVQLAVTCLVKGRSGSAWFDDVSVVLAGEGVGPAPAPRAPAVTVQTASIEVDTNVVLRDIPRTLYGANVEWIWNGNYLWNEATGQPQTEVVRLTRELGVSLIRYPGGQYSDFYHWKNGVGPVERRPEVLHAAGKGDRSRPVFGTDEALTFARQVGAELLVTVNVGTGTAAEAAEWVRYVNARDRRVRHWEVGNELYMNEGSKTSKAITVPPQVYAKRFREFARAMRAADPGVKIGAIGGENQGSYVNVNYPDWNRTVLQNAGAEMDFLSVHNAYSPVLISGDDRDLRKVYGAMLAAPLLIARNLKTVEAQIAEYVPTRAGQIGIAVTEWGPLFQFDPRSGYVDHAKTLGSALFVASTLKAFIESPRTEIANFFLLNDLSVLGLIGSRDPRFPPAPDWAATAKYYAFQLYTRHFGDRLVQSKTQVAAYDSERAGLVDPVKGVPYLDVVCSLSADGGTLYILAVNKHFDADINASIAVQGFRIQPRAAAWTLSGTGIDAHTGTAPLRVPGLAWVHQIEDPLNPRFSRGGTAEVTLAPSSFEARASGLVYRFPRHSVTSLVLTRAK